MARKKKGGSVEPLNGEAHLSEAILKSAEVWAIECGLRGPFDLAGPDKVDYPQHGYGFVVLVSELNPYKPGARVRMGTARFTDQGERAMWTIDGSVVL